MNRDVLPTGQLSLVFVIFIRYSNVGGVRHRGRNWTKREENKKMAGDKERRNQITTQ